MKNQQDLFDSSQDSLNLEPLASKLRPNSIELFVGFQELLENYPFLKNEVLPSLIFTGPPGSGKTSLAEVLANKIEGKIFHFNAVLGGVKELKELIKVVERERKEFQIKPILFIDEIHRFNKAQQDALLPYVEKGSFIFFGATTENPKVSVNRALLSRVRIVRLQHHSESHILKIIQHANNSLKLNAPDDVLTFFSKHADGDARRALNFLEALSGHDDFSIETASKIISEDNKLYDKSGDRHYDVISAFIKSLRGSDPDSAILWLAVMLDGGEDPRFIARRLVIFASEDVGNADPSALTLAVSALQVVSQIGMPEARITLAQATTYLASTVKSNTSYTAINEALSYVKENPTIQVPTHLRNHHPDKKNYRYPHSFKEHFVKQEYSPERISFYRPSSQGTEARIKERLKKLWD